MAIDQFWENVRQAAGNAIPRGVFTEVAGAPPQSVVETRLRAARGWRRGVSVAGYDEADFDFLPQDERQRLSGAVNQFTAALSQDPPADPTQPDVAVGAFVTVLDVLNFARYADVWALPLGKRVEERLRQQGWPKEVRELRFSTGGPFDRIDVFNVTAILSEQQLKTESRFLEAARSLRKRLREVAEVEAPNWFTHISFRTDKPLTEYAEQPDEDEVPSGV